MITNRHRLQQSQLNFIIGISLSLLLLIPLYNFSSFEFLKNLSNYQSFIRLFPFLITPLIVILSLRLMIVINHRFGYKEIDFKSLVVPAIIIAISVNMYTFIGNYKLYEYTKAEQEVNKEFSPIVKIVEETVKNTNRKTPDIKTYTVRYTIDVSDHKKRDLSVKPELYIEGYSSLAEPQPYVELQPGAEYEFTEAIDTSLIQGKITKPQSQISIQFTFKDKYDHLFYTSLPSTLKRWSN
ncbi:MAG: hypothetical protein ACEQSA_03190 [Weeksellaceae bacterium]